MELRGLAIAIGNKLSGVPGPQCAANRNGHGSVKAQCVCRLSPVACRASRECSCYLKNGVLRHKPDKNEPDADCSITMTRSALNAIAIDTEAGFAAALENGELTIEGDGVKLGQVFGAVDEMNMHFPLVTP